MPTVPGLTDLGEGRYRYRVYGPGLEGERKYWSLQFAASGKRELSAILARFKHEAQSGVLAQREREKRARTTAPGRTTTVAAYCERWLHLRAASRKVGEKTLHRYRGLIRDMIVPALGATLLADLSPADVNDAVATWRTQARADRKAGALSARTIHHALATLKAILKSAVDEEIIAKNPAKITVSKSDGREIASLDASQVLELLAGLRGTTLEVPTLLAVRTGLRRGELLGLRWSDVDLDGAVLHVRQSLERLPDGTLQFKKPKTPKSRRSVPLAAPVVEALRGHLMAQSKDALVHGIVNRHDLVFPWIDGERWVPDKFSSAFYYYVRDHKLPIVSVHGLRHTFASLGLAAGVPMKIVSETLGHANISITADRYTHALPEQHVAGAATLDAWFANAEKKRDGATAVASEIGEDAETPKSLDDDL